MKFQELALPERELAEPTAQALRDAPTAPGAAPRAKPDTTLGKSVQRAYLEPGLTSRLPVDVPAQRMRAVQSIELPPNMRATGLLATAARVVVRSVDRYTIFSSAGEKVAAGPMGSGEMILAPELGLMIISGSNGGTAAHDLADGKRSFLINSPLGGNYRRSVRALSGQRLISAGIKELRPIEDPTLARPRPGVLIHSQLLGKGMPVKSGYAVDESSRTVLRETDSLLMAAAGDSVVVATRDRIHRLAANLDVRSVLAGRFEPLALSVDEAGRMYLIVTAQGQNRLWVLSLEGERLLSIALPAPRPGGYQPPMIGYGHTVFVPVEHRIFVVDPRGEHRSDYPISSAFAGAVVLPSDALLISDGPDLVRIEPDGRSTTLFTAAGQTLLTAPIALDDGHVWVATERQLIRLAPEVSR